ncbi:short-chain dehydrogenase [Lacibacter luteus]|uniref:Short-chain dehydrogenase n=1 Tax=Lacibacter luteus TaxID=2508719 RepID=A0A4Q1CFY1_9BACT|nr:short-chain dehydrogenase [Lacibacter luteus]RXK58926.1 short-chain dehydrogenase [Lacibacter luteus]
MTNDMIEKFIETRKSKKVNIFFKQRSTVKGIFIHNNDYEELKNKNFWRIVSEAKIEEWSRTKDASLARIFNGAEFTKLSEAI